MLVRRDAEAAVGHRHHRGLAVHPPADRDVRAAGRVLHRVLDEVAQREAQTVGIAFERDGAIRRDDIEARARSAGLPAHLVDHAVHERVEVDARARRKRTSRFHSSEVQQRLHQVLEARGFAGEDAVVVLAAGLVRHPFGVQHLGHLAHRRQG